MEPLIWTPMTPGVELRKKEVHLWQAPPSFSAEESLLSPSERARAARHTHEETRHRYVRTRTALRQILSGYLQLPAHELKIADRPHGKPFLVQASDTTQLEFNCSHSCKGTLIACAWENPVGVDLEETGRCLAHADIARRFFTAQEQKAWKAEKERVDAFFRIWTRKEAVLKAHGGGLGAGMGSFSVATVLPPPLAAHNVSAIWVPSVEFDKKSFRLFDLAPMPGMQAALAVTGDVRQLRFFQLTAPTAARDIPAATSP